MVKLTSDKYMLDAGQHCYIEFINNSLPIPNKMSIRNSKLNLKERKICWYWNYKNIENECNSRVWNIRIYFQI